MDRNIVMSKAAQIKPDGSVVKVINTNKGVNVGDGDEMIQYPKSIWTIWSDAELNAIGYAKFNEDRVPSDKRSTGTTDTFADGKVHRSHTTKDFVPTPVIDPTPTLPDKDAWTEDVPAVMEGEVEVKAATTIDHPATTKPNPDYDYVALRNRDYEHTPKEMVIALWEQVVESRSTAVDDIETKRQEVKTRFPK
jgi:hypothetical protein|tara:strand:- start:3184 stop:3762 length:579 start_codon:yes stop_codon:yes gene_type:complete